MKSKRRVQEVQALKREQIQQTQFQKTHKFWFAQTLKLILSRLYAQRTTPKVAFDFFLDSFEIPDFIGEKHCISPLPNHPNCTYFYSYCSNISLTLYWPCKYRMTNRGTSQ